MSMQSIAWQLMSEEDYAAYIEERMKDKNDTYERLVKDGITPTNKNIAITEFVEKCLTQARRKNEQ